MSTTPRSIRTPRLLLRPWRVADASLLKGVLGESLDHLLPWVSWVRRQPRTLSALEAELRRGRLRFQAGQDQAYAVFDASGAAQLLGSAGLHHRVGAGGVELSYWLAAGATGRGLATEAAAALTRVAFERRGALFAEIHCDPDNQRSARVAERLGYRLAARIDGQIRNARARPRDTVIYRLLSGEFAEAPAAAVPVEMG